MTTPQQALSTCSLETLVVNDAKGRELVVKRLGAIDRLRLLKAAGPELSQNDAWLNMASLAVCVTAINGVPRPVPVTEPQIEAFVSELGDEGLLAAADALEKLGDGAALPDGAHEGN